MIPAASDPDLDQTPVTTPANSINMGDSPTPSSTTSSLGRSSPSESISIPFSVKLLASSFALLSIIPVLCVYPLTLRTWHDFYYPDQNGKTLPFSTILEDSNWVAHAASLIGFITFIPFNTYNNYHFITNLYQTYKKQDKKAFIKRLLIYLPLLISGFANSYNMGITFKDWAYVGSLLQINSDDPTTISYKTLHMAAIAISFIFPGIANAETLRHYWTDTKRDIHLLRRFISPLETNERDRAPIIPSLPFMRARINHYLDRAAVFCQWNLKPSLIRNAYDSSLSGKLTTTFISTVGPCNFPTKRFLTFSFFAFALAGFGNFFACPLLISGICYLLNNISPICENPSPFVFSINSLFGDYLSTLFAIATFVLNAKLWSDLIRNKCFRDLFAIREYSLSKNLSDFRDKWQTANQEGCRATSRLLWKTVKPPLFRVLIPVITAFLFSLVNIILIMNNESLSVFVKFFSIISSTIGNTMLARYGMIGVVDDCANKIEVQDQLQENIRECKEKLKTLPDNEIQETYNRIFVQPGTTLTNHDYEAITPPDTPAIHY